MRRPEVPTNENDRLHALHSLHLLDTPPEERFDRITRLTRKLFDVPIALVSLVDSGRQWFKARTGLDSEETPRELSFCGHAILGDETLQVPDTTRDERFADNPLVTGEPYIRFYAGHPISSPGGHHLGTLCIIDQKPRQLDDEQLDMLANLAAIVEQEITVLQMATTDELTGLSNRRGFTLLAQQSMNQSRRSQQPLTLLYLDLDHFKPINDELGHEAGDRVLAHFASQLHQTFRESDIIARVGGDEFVVLLSGNHSDETDAALERLERNVREYPPLRERNLRLDFSCGVVEYDPAQHGTIEALMDSADREMFKRKRGKQVG